MLTDSEKRWIIEREIFRARTGYFYWDGYYWEENLQIEDMQDAAAFEARVAAKLATLLDESYFHIDTGSYESCREVCPAHSLCPKGFNPDCRTTFVKYARIAVEEEMNAD